jgi:hypothetical protein
MARRCTDCRQDLPETSFYWVSKASGKLRGQCKDCMRARKLKQRDPAWTPACSRCGAQLTERPGSGRRLCAACFDATYDTEDRRLNGAHRIRLKPCRLWWSEAEVRAWRGVLGLQTVAALCRVPAPVRVDPC